MNTNTASGLVAGIVPFSKDLARVKIDRRTLRWGSFLSTFTFIVFIVPMVTFSLAVSIDPVLPLYKSHLGSTLSSFMTETLVIFVATLFIGYMLVYTRVIVPQSQVWASRTSRERNVAYGNYILLLALQAVLFQYIMQYSGAFYSMYDSAFWGKSDVAKMGIEDQSTVDPKTKEKNFSDLFQPSFAQTSVEQLKEYLPNSEEWQTRMAFLHGSEPTDIKGGRRVQKGGELPGPVKKALNYAGIIMDNRIDNPNVDVLAAMAFQSHNSNPPRTYPVRHDEAESSQKQLFLEKMYLNSLQVDSKKLEKKQRQYRLWLNWVPRTLCAIQSLGLGPLAALGFKTMARSANNINKASVDGDIKNITEATRANEVAMKSLRKVQVMVMNITQGYQLIGFCGLFILLTVASIFVKDTDFPRRNRGVFIAEVFATMFVMGSVFLTMRRLRNGTWKQAIMDFLFFGIGMALFHVLAQFSGMYSYTYTQPELIKAHEQLSKAPAAAPQPGAPSTRAAPSMVVSKPVTPSKECRRMSANPADVECRTPAEWAEIDRQKNTPGPRTPVSSAPSATPSSSRTPQSNAVVLPVSSISEPGFRNPMAVPSGNPKVFCARLSQEDPAHYCHPLDEYNRVNKTKHPSEPASNPETKYVCYDGNAPRYCYPDTESERANAAKWNNKYTVL